MRRLCSRPHREKIGRRVVTREHSPRLERHATAAVLPDFLFEDVRRSGKGRIDVAVDQPKRGRDIRVKILMRAGSVVLRRLPAIAGGGQDIVMDDQRHRGILGEVARFSDHDCDGLTDVTDFVARQCDLRARSGNRRIGQQHRHRLTAHRLRQIVGSDYRVHAGNHHRHFGVDRKNLGVSMRRPDETGMQQTGRLFHVIDETPTPRQECGILQPLHARAEMLRPHNDRPTLPDACARPHRAPPQQCQHSLCSGRGFP